MIGGLCFMAIATTATSGTLYVSPTAAPGGDGSIQRPFAQIQQAIDAVDGRGQSRIVLRGGTYLLTAPLKLGPGCSHLTIENQPREKPVVSGGEALKLREEAGLWKTMLPQGRRFTSLYVDGHRRYRPRLPKTGYFTVAEVFDKDKPKGWGRVHLQPGEVSPALAGSEAEFCSFAWWTMARLRIASIDGDVATFVDPAKGAAVFMPFIDKGRYFIDNAPGEIGPGEWRIDGNELAYRPLPNESLAKSTVVAPLCDRLMLLDGCDGVTLKGVAFRHTNWVLGPGGRSFPQAEVDIPGAIQAHNVRGLKVVGCEVSQTDGYAVELGKGCCEGVVEKCVLRDLGAGGVKIGDMPYEEDESKVAGYNVVRNNLIVHGGRIHPAGEGVWVGASPYNKIERNEIVDFYYTGISVGWSWGYGKSNAHHNLVAGNLIHQIGQGVLSDMGGIYHLGVAPGTVIRGNLIYDVTDVLYGGWGVYLDEGSSHVLVEGNLTYDTRSPGFHQHYGQDNLVRDNLFAYGRQGQVRLSKIGEGLSVTFDHNVMIWADAPMMDPDAAKTGYAFDHNVYWRTDGKPIDFRGLSWEAWRAEGMDLHSVIEDPLFVDPGRRDFHLKAGSPLPKLGIGAFVKALDAWPVARRYKGTIPPAFPLR